jgi:hypothetical protein
MTIRRGSGLSAGAFTGESVRPAGYQFPIGLSSQGLVSGTTGNVVASFVASGTFVPPTGVTSVDYLVVAGGGARWSKWKQPFGEAVVEVLVVSYWYWTSRNSRNTIYNYCWCWWNRCNLVFRRDLKVQTELFVIQDHHLAHSTSAMVEVEVVMGTSTGPLLMEVLVVRWRVHSNR